MHRCLHTYPWLALFLVLLLPAIAACGTATTSTPSSTSSVPSLLTPVPNTGPTGLPFYDPQGLSVDPHGTIYVADGSSDEGNYRLLKLAPNGHILAEWHAFQRTFHANANGPIGVICDPDGNLDLADASSNRIVKVSPTGTILMTWGQAGQFDGLNVLALDTSGNLYVSEYDKHQVEKFAPSGHLSQTIALPPATDDPTQPAGPIGIVVAHNGTIYVADQANSRILQLSSTGTLLHSWGKEGSQPGQFDHPGGLVSDAQGNLYVGDDNNYRIEKLSPAGKFLTLWAMPKKDKLLFNTGPGPMAFNPLGNDLYTSDTDASGTHWRLLRFSLSGTLLSTL